MLALGACAAPSGETAVAGAQGPGTAAEPAPPQAPPVVAPGASTLPPQPDAPHAPSTDAEAPAPAQGPVQVDRSCRTDADCTVKNVGNCCGAYPACVNVDSPTDPEGVRAACAKDGMMSTCGFREIQGCQCVAGSCTANDNGVQLQ
ncbi:hypothetical protein [Marilutibacter aestuarii]|uniref:hypothetical protein n=1 Tax=Marilutibacter aestuarii TaxID=1706195 RepID=UPI003CCC78C5